MDPEESGLMLFVKAKTIFKRQKYLFMIYFNNFYDNKCFGCTKETSLEAFLLCTQNIHLIGKNTDNYLWGLYMYFYVYLHIILTIYLRDITSKSSVSQIYFELVSISKNRSSNFRGFAVLTMTDSADFSLLLCLSCALTVSYVTIFQKW